MQKLFQSYSIYYWREKKQFRDIVISKYNHKCMKNTFVRFIDFIDKI